MPDSNNSSNRNVVLKNEVILPKSGDNYMEVRHISVKGTNEEIGEALAGIVRNRLITHSIATGS
ncbi:MAG: hypothetical protein WC891_04145 [Actinomycetota bacterium]